MKKLLFVYILFPILSFGQASETPPPPMGRGVESVEGGPAAPGLPISNSTYSFIGFGFALSLGVIFLQKYRFEK